MRRLDQLRRPSGIALEMRIIEVEEAFQQISNLMSGCPEELRLRESSNASAGYADVSTELIPGSSIGQMMLSPVYVRCSKTGRRLWWRMVSSFNRPISIRRL